MVKRLRHRPFTAVTGVQIPLESLRNSCADVAQLAEQLICNQQVNGSSPFIGFNGQIPEWPKGTDCKSAGTAFEGSNPSPPILHNTGLQAVKCNLGCTKFGLCIKIYQRAGVAELADAQDLKSCGTYTPIRVRFPLPA